MGTVRNGTCGCAGKHDPNTENQRLSMRESKGADSKYRQELVEMLVNKIYLYDDKMTVLCNTQDGHFDVDLKDVSSLKGQLEGTVKIDIFDWVIVSLR